MKYILNKLQEKTTNNFRVNEIKLDLDLPENFKLKKYEIKNNKLEITEEEKTEIEQIYLSKYFDCTYTAFSEYLAKDENIFLSVDEVRTILRDRYIFSPRTHKSTRKRIRKQSRYNC